MNKPSISINGCTLELTDDDFEICCGPKIQVTPVEGGFRHIIHDTKSGRKVTFTAKNNHSWLLGPAEDNKVRFSVDVFDENKSLADMVQEAEACGIHS